MTNSTE